MKPREGQVPGAREPGFQPHADSVELVDPGEATSLPEADPVWSLGGVMPEQCPLPGSRGDMDTRLTGLC